MENEHTVLNGTTTATITKVKRGYTPLLLLTTVLLVGAFYYAEQQRGRHVAGGSGTTTRGATPIASLTRVQEAESMGLG